MPSSSTAQLNAPSDWDEFENICADLFALEWNYPEVVRYGRKGQRQTGVDIHGQQNGEDVAVQCKGKRIWPPTELTTSEIDIQVAEAINFRPHLKKFIIATIANDDVHIQDHVNAISERHRQANLFSVHAYGWGELTRRIKGHPKILDTYFNIYTVPLLRDELRKSPDATADRVIERLQEVMAPNAAFTGPVPQAARNDADIFRAGLTDALERDFSLRHRRAIERSFFPEVKTDEFYPLAQTILDGNANAISPTLRRRILLRAARSTAVRNNPAMSERLLAAARPLEAPDPLGPAEARLAEAKGDPDSAIRILRDVRDDDSRSTLLNVLVRAKGDDKALEWFEAEHLSIPNLTPYGVMTLCQIHLRKNDLERVRLALVDLTYEQTIACPYFYFLRGAIRFASLLPKPEQAVALSGLPLDVRHAHTIRPDSEVANEIDAAAADLQRAYPLTIELQLHEAPRLIGAYLTWFDLLHPGRRQSALAQLRSDMSEPSKALSLIQFAFAYDRKFDSAAIAEYLQKRDTLGGLNDDELRASLSLFLNKEDARHVSELISKYRERLQGSFGQAGIASIEIQALAKTGDATSARLLLDANKELFPPDVLAGFETDIAKAEGADPVAEHLRLYEATKTPETLRALVTALIQKNDTRGIARYAEELYPHTNDPRDIAFAAKASADSGDNTNFVRIVEAHPFLRNYDVGLNRYYAWQLFRLGRLDEATEITNTIRRDHPSQRDLNLEVALAIETGEWELIAQPLAAFLERAGELDGLTLIQAANLSQAAGQGPLLDLVRAAIQKGQDNAHVLLGAFTIFVEEGLEDDRPEVHDWFRQALALSGPDGPIQQFELKEILAKQIEWNEFTNKINEAIARGDMPLVVAGPGLRTTVVDVVLRNLVRNSALTDARKRTAVPLFTGRRVPSLIGETHKLALDITALMVLGWLGLLDKVLNEFPSVVLPASVLTELFEGRRRIRQFQKSRLQRAVQIRDAIARGRLKVLRAPTIVRDSLTNEVGIELSALIREAKATGGIVVRPAPVHRLGLEGRDADMSAYTDCLCDLHGLLAVLNEANALTQPAETTAKQFFSLQDKGWPNSAKPAADRPLLLDGLTLVHLQSVDLFDTVLSVFREAHIHSSTEEEATVLIEHDRHVADVLRIIDDIRQAVRKAHAAGKIIFGSRRSPSTESDGAGSEMSTLNLLSDLASADLAVFDDRALNKELFVQDQKGHRVRAATSLDLIEELLQRGVITQDERNSLRYRLRIGGALLVPVDGHELVAAAARNRQSESPEFRAIHESIDLARIAEMPRFPAEIPWFVTVNQAGKSAIMQIWNGEPSAERAATLADAIVEVSPRPEDWVGRWEGAPPPGWIEAVKRVNLSSFTLPAELDESRLDSYNDWIERSLLSPLRELSPERYQALIEHLRSFILISEEASNGS